MDGLGKILILIGIVLVIIGIIWTAIGKLPGDFVFKKGNTTVYLPIMTSIIISIILSLIFYFFGKFK
ncbi:DUF2905 domain-containing protein [Allobacillus sp. GCM10007491]|uniref:DUF2905 domain-containing protein n=1 Tax=Allobacillus saliphilus TaxID=2912308 RepID=A0A941HSX8_9BACI|nr:DUF2905 domain-containing protein [Allobacillus saliphilus]MBR7553402.1 DUF2905 domain-containing protein [Allobacillus saliphilus]